MIVLCARLAIFVGLAMSGHLKADLAHARLVEALPAGSEAAIRVVLGGIENLSTGLVAEREMIIEGLQEVKLYEAPATLSHQVVFDELLKRRAGVYETQFECEGRDCGSSADWANGVFGFRLLYGPEQYQHYWVGLDTSGGIWQSIYVGRRGNGKVYYLISTIQSSNQSIGDFVDYPGLKLWRLPLSGYEQSKARVLQQLQYRLDGAKALTLVVAVSAVPFDRPNEALGIDLTQRQAEEIAKDLRVVLPEEVEVIAQGLGLSAPVPDLAEGRVDFLLLD